MSVISEEDEKENNQLTLKLNQSLKESSENSNSSEKEDEFVASSKCLIIQPDYIGKTASPPINHKKENKKIYDLEDDIFSQSKKNLFSSEIVQKIDKNRCSEMKSTEINSIRVRNYNSPRKRYSIVKLVEKEKKYKKGLFSTNKKEEKEISPIKKERRDIFGNIINKKNKKNVKVSFLDLKTSQPLVNVVEIESFKKYNYVIGLPKEKKIEKHDKCQCCITF